MRHSFGRWQSQNCFSCWSSSYFAFFKLKAWGSWVYLEDKLEKIKFVYISEEALMDSSASGSSKRARALCGSGTQIPSCLVDGCTADLGKCRDYHRRHKVCELHSKIPRVTIQGQEQPFCQQCSRFHSLEAFDEGKRSCRKRLDGHNRRRRKAQPDSLPTNSGRFFSNVQGTKFIPFGSPELLYTNAAAPAWAGIVRGKTDVLLQSSHSHLDFSYGNIFQGSSSHNYKGEKQFPFIEGGGGQPLVNGLGRVVDSSNRALSLLSSPFQPEAWGIGSNHMAQADSSSIPIAIPVCPADHSLMPNLKGMDGESSSSNATFEIGPDESSTTTTGSGTHHHQTLCLSWE